MPVAPRVLWQTMLDGPRYTRWHPRLDWIVFEGEGAPGTLVTVKPKRGRQTAFIVRDSVPDRLLVLETGIGPAMRFTLSIALAPVPGNSQATKLTALVNVRGFLAGLGLRYGGRALAEGLDRDLAALMASAAA